VATDLFKTLDTISAFHNYNSWIFENIQPYLKGDVLDVGSGIGDVAKYYFNAPAVKKVVLSDASEEMMPVLRERFVQDKRFDIMTIDISGPAQAVGKLGQIADTITCINVLEHIEDDAHALANIRSLLKPNGNFVLMVPALSAIYGTLDSLVGHYRRYDKKMVRGIADKSGLYVKEQFYMNMVGIFSWFVAGRILKRKKFDPTPCKTLDNMVPIIKAMEKCLKPPIGQSLITICGKQA
jgi:2-polyprenyl-3-methyl-5-hydroxy-6-metoxy-1,4-benzoquinol methylase